MRLIDYICQVSGWTPGEGSPEETIGKLEMAISSAKKMKKIDWTEIDGLVASLRLSCGNAADGLEGAWNSSSLYCLKANHDTEI